ncbi:hypothetical protein ACROYT_G035625 [Oculina patagonica]
MEAVRMSVRSERPFDEFKVIYLHCIDLDTKKFTPIHGELESSSGEDDDALGDCCPWLDLSSCKCNCTTFPSLGNVLVDPETNVTVKERCVDSDESDEDKCATFDEKDEFDLGEEESDDEEKSVTLYSEYVALRGSSFHEDCQATLKKCRELLGAKKTVELRVLPEPDNVRDCNALIIQAKVNDQWDRIGYIPKEKVPKFTAAIRQNELRDVRFKNIRCQYFMSDNPTWTFLASVLVVKTGKWLPNDGKYRTQFIT